MQTLTFPSIRGVDHNKFMLLLRFITFLSNFVNLVELKRSLKWLSIGLLDFNFWQICKSLSKHRFALWRPTDKILDLILYLCRLYFLLFHKHQYQNDMERMIQDKVYLSQRLYLTLIVNIVWPNVISCCMIPSSLLAFSCSKNYKSYMIYFLPLLTSCLFLDFSAFELPYDFAHLSIKILKSSMFWISL